MTKRIGTIALFLALCYPAIQSAYASGTPSGTSITNKVTATYNDGGNPVTKTADAPAITVDNKVNLTVTSNGNATVLPGSTNQVLPFTVKNEGNTTQRYALTYANSAGVVMENIRIYRDNNSDGTLDGGDTLYSDASTFGDVLADGTIKILIVADTKAGATSGQNEIYHLIATTVDAGTTTVTLQTNTANTVGVDVVFADIAGTAAGDGVRGGQHSDKGTYTVNLLALNLSKSVEVTSDPKNLTDKPKAIPGAILTYTIKVSVSGTGTTANVVITDPIPDNTTYVANSLTLNSAPLADLGRIGGTPVTVTVTLGDITKDTAEQIITFQVKINE